MRAVVGRSFAVVVGLSAVFACSTFSGEGPPVAPPGDDGAPPADAASDAGSGDDTGASEGGKTDAETVPTATTITSGLASPRAITTSGNALFYVETGKVHKMRFGMADEVISTQLPTPSAIAVLNGNLFVADATAKRVVEVNETTGGIVTEIFDAETTVALAAGGNNLWFLTNDGRIRSNGANGIKQSSLIYSELYDVDFAGGFAYFVEAGAGKIWKTAAADQAATLVADDQGGCRAVAGGNATVAFFTIYAGGEIRRVSTGSPYETVAAKQDRPLSIAVDGTHVYWVTLDGFLRRAPRAGAGVVRTLAGGAKQSASMGYGHLIALSDSDVYWLSFDDGRLLKTPK